MYTNFIQLQGNSDIIID